MAALPIDNIASFDNNLHAARLTKTVVTPLGGNNNSPCSRNNLLKKDNIANNDYSSTLSSKSTTNLKTVISFDEDQTVPIDALRKKVIMKLIDISPHTTPQKQKVFDSLV